MKQHRQSTAAMSLVTVAALVVTAWASSAVADDPAPSLLDLPEQGLIFEVFRRERSREGHQGMKIVVVQTRTKPPVAYGLVFLQTGDGVRGQGIICESRDLKRNGFLECSQQLEDYEEILKIGAIDSEFCNKLRGDLEGNPNRQTPNGKNPVAEKNECKKEKCICYDVEHRPPDDENPNPRLLAPPNSGSGTGGHN
jgi:hypothetical protein